MEYSTQRKIQSQQRNIIIWVNGLYFAELTERSTYDQKLIKKKSYLKLTLVKVKREKKRCEKNTNKDSKNKKQLPNTNWQGIRVMWDMLPD